MAENTYKERIRPTIEILQGCAAAIKFPTIDIDLPSKTELEAFHGASSEQFRFIDQESIIEGMAYLLDEVLPQSFKPLDPILDNGYWLAKCDKCYWWGSSRLLNGGGRDYWGEANDVTCPVCGTIDIDEMVDSPLQGDGDTGKEGKHDTK